jgi:DNA-binding LacI/PurR family transcriptional regulator
VIDEIDAMKTASRPKYLTLAEEFARQIRSGELQPGDRLPSFTQMRAQWGATPATVERIHAQLEREHLIERRHRSGVYVADARSGSTPVGTLGFVALRFDGTRLHPYNHHLLQGVQREAKGAGVQIMLLDYGAIAASRGKIDGLLIYERELFKFLKHRETGVPCVSLLHQTDGMAAVTADDFAGARSAAQHLLELGHTRIACLMGTAARGIQDPLGAARLRGYRAALKQSGIAPNNNWVRPVLYNPLENYAERGRSLMQQWLREDWNDLGCTAILTQNDDVAIGVIGALREAGLQVPRDVSVVGFDGAGIDAHFAPRLTTVEVPLEEIGARGTQLLLQRIEGKTEGKTNDEHIALPTRLRVGDSSAGLGVLPTRRA